MKAKLVYYEEHVILGRYVVELTIYKVPDPTRYPDGVKYGLVCFDPETGLRVLMDNHYPKGHHIHLGPLEMPYEYRSDRELIQDFRRFVWSYMGVRI